MRPLVELDSLLQSEDLVLEDFDLGRSIALNIIDVGVHEGGDSFRFQVGSNHGSLGRVGATIGVRANELSLKGGVLTVDEDALP